jgi:hypothetical protein
MNKIISIPFFLLCAGISLTNCGQNSASDDKKSSEAPKHRSVQTVGAAEEDNSTSQWGYKKKLAHLVPEGNSPEVPYYVILGGNHSCRRALASMGHESPYETPMYQNFERNLLDNFKVNFYPIHYLVSCYDKKRKIFYATSQDPTTILPAAEQTIRDVILSETLPGQRIILVGHSYGGWLAMQLAADIAPQRPIVGLFTLDPISALQCTPKLLDGCKQAPTDIGPQTQQAIAQSVGVWENFYQTQTKLLHSSAIPAASVNTLVQASHITIHSNAAIWSRVFQADRIQVAPQYGQQYGQQQAPYNAF